jgi:hypothetical protein
MCFRRAPAEGGHRLDDAVAPVETSTGGQTHTIAVELVRGLARLLLEVEKVSCTLRLAGDPCHRH